MVLVADAFSQSNSGNKVNLKSKKKKKKYDHKNTKQYMTKYM